MSQNKDAKIRIKEIFSILKLECTKEESQIRGAYLALLRETNPEDDPEGFKRLRAAYEEALVYARTEEEESEEAGIQTSEWLGEDSASAHFFRSFEEIYASIARRTDRAAWEELLQAPVLSTLDEGETVKWGLFERLARQYRLPCEIWRLLDDTFLIRENQAEFKEHLPEEFVDYILYKIADEKGESDFPLDRLTGPDGADFDGFLDAYYEYTRTEWGADRASLQQQKDAFHRLELYGVGHPRLELERARLLLCIGEQGQAQKLLVRLLADAPEDVWLQLVCAHVLCEQGEIDTAEKVYRRYLKVAEASTAEESFAEDSSTEKLGAEPDIMLTENNRFEVFWGMARLLAARENWKEARRYALEARKIHITQELNKLLETVLVHVIEELKISQDALSDEDFRILIWSLIQTERGQEGLEILEAHSEYEKDSAAYHKMKTTLYLVNSRNEQAAAEAVRWRTCLLQEYDATTSDAKNAETVDAEAAENAETVDAEAAENVEIVDAEAAKKAVDNEMISDAEAARAREDTEAAEQKLNEEQKKRLSECYNMEGRALSAWYSELTAHPETVQTDTSQTGQPEEVRTDTSRTGQSEAAQSDAAQTEQRSFEQKVFDRAMRCLTRASELYPEDLDCRMQRMLLCREKKDYGRMVEECEQMLAIDDRFY